jgi:hypothetical protein
MKTVTGVFRDHEKALHAMSALKGAGFSRDHLTFLCPASQKEAIHKVATSDAEPPGVGSAIGGMVGGALGIAGGFELGVAATALIPGVGPILAFGMAGAVLLGLGGVVGGAALGKAADDKATEGVPSDEIFFYEDALRQGRSVVMVTVEHHWEEERAQKILGDAEAESLDAARRDWWLGLRDAEEEHYRALGHNFEQDQEIYRAGFESALRRECRGNSFNDEADCLKWWYPDDWDSDAFRRGFKRGHEYWEKRAADVARSEQPR